ncbi:cob(I)yrinic acid a,c-diamide adenosyltransferase [Bacteroidota bacterium]
MDNRKSTIYTKGGDRGETSLLGGRRVPKYNIRIEAYGTIDELMANTALLMDFAENASVKKELQIIIERLMSAASVVASDGNNLHDNMPKITEDDVNFLEERIDEMDFELPELHSFILPGGHVSASQAHIARTICRRTERIILRLNENEEVDSIIIKYFNRLSDYYFLLSRKLCNLNNVDEIPWKP